jgi:hypothetical protein
MNDDFSVPDSQQRLVLDCLRFGDWKLREHLPVAVSDETLEQMLKLGWVELQSQKASAKIRISGDGLIALKFFS